MLAFIGGTGLAKMDDLVIRQRHSASTPFGEAAAPVLEGELQGRRVLFLARHGDPHTLLPHQVNYRANLWALKEAGACAIVAANAVGGISADAPTGVLVLPDQIIDYSYGRDTTFFDDPSESLVHVDFTWPFDLGLRDALKKQLCDTDLNWTDGGCYGVTQGPRLETAAEVGRMERDGCDIVGMTGMPEAVLARELNVPYAMLSLVVNPAAGKSTREISMEEIKAVIHSGMADVCRLLTAFAGSYRPV